MGSNNSFEGKHNLIKIDIYVYENIMCVKVYNFVSFSLCRIFVSFALCRISQEYTLDGSWLEFAFLEYYPWNSRDSQTLLDCCILLCSQTIENMRLIINGRIEGLLIMYDAVMMASP